MMYDLVINEELERWISN